MKQEMKIAIKAINKWVFFDGITHVFTMSG